MGVAVSVQTMRKTILSVCVALALVTLAPSAFADDLVGASGECYDEDYENGGQAHIAVTEDGELEHDGIVNEDDPTDTEGGLADALAVFAQGLPDSTGNDEQDACTAPTDGEDGREGVDYLEVHAGPAQVCYNGEVHVSDGEDGLACDTRPHGPPA